MISIEHKHFILSNKLESNSSSNMYAKYKDYYCDVRNEDGYPIEIFICVLCDILCGLGQQRVFLIEDKRDIYAVYPNTDKKTIRLDKENEAVLSNNLNRIVLSQKYPPFAINANIEGTQLVEQNVIKKAISSLPTIKNKKKEDLNIKILIGSIVASFLINSVSVTPFVNSLNEDAINQKSLLKQRNDDNLKQIAILSKKIKEKKFTQNRYSEHGNQISSYVEKYQAYLDGNNKAPGKMVISNGEIAYYAK